MVELAAPILQSLLPGNLYPMMALGLPVLLVGKYARRALEIASRGYVLVAGQKAMKGAGQEILNDESLKRIFLGCKGWADLGGISSLTREHSNVPS
jgi:branched-chain amino acid transport system ATP-binding protein